MEMGALIPLLVFFAVAAPLLGLLNIGLGATQVRDPHGRFTPGKRRRTERLHNSIPMLRYAAPDEQISIYNQMTRLNGWATVGLGLGFFLGTALLGVVSVLIGVTRDPLSGLFIYVALEAPTLTLGTALGIAQGFRHYGRIMGRAGQVSSFAPWQARTPGDYRAAWLAWLLAALATSGAALAIFGALVVSGNPEGAPLPFPPFITAQARLVTVLLAIPTLCGPLVAWLTAHWIATTPPVISSPYFGLANDAEDVARASLTSLTLSLVWRSTGWLTAVMGFTFLLTCLFAVPAPSLYWLVAIGALLIVGFAVMMLGLLGRLLRGRLGGRRTGWPWSLRTPAAPAPITPRQG
jgi:hypothetical protein